MPPSRLSPGRKWASRQTPGVRPRRASPRDILAFSQRHGPRTGNDGGMPGRS